MSEHGSSSHVFDCVTGFHGIPVSLFVLVLVSILLVVVVLLLVLVLLVFLFVFLLTVDTSQDCRQ